jgi:hypothetical protein
MVIGKVSRKTVIDLVCREILRTWSIRKTIQRRSTENFKDKVCKEKEICIGKVGQETVTGKVCKKAEHLLYTISEL